jgi:hypothetical protein
MNGEAEDGRIHVSALKSRTLSARAARTVRDEATREARTAERVRAHIHIYHRSHRRDHCEHRLYT